MIWNKGLWTNFNLLCKISSNFDGHWCDSGYEKRISRLTICRYLPFEQYSAYTVYAPLIIITQMVLFLSFFLPILVILLLLKSKDIMEPIPSNPWTEDKLLLARDMSSSLGRSLMLIASMLLPWNTSGSRKMTYHFLRNQCLNFGSLWVGSLVELLHTMCLM